MQRPVFGKSCVISIVLFHSSICPSHSATSEHAMFQTTKIRCFIFASHSHFSSKWWPFRRMSPAALWRQGESDHLCNTSRMPVETGSFPNNPRRFTIVQSSNLLQLGNTPIQMKQMAQLARWETAVASCIPFGAAVHRKVGLDDFWWDECRPFFGTALFSVAFSNFCMSMYKYRVL